MGTTASNSNAAAATAAAVDASSTALREQLHAAQLANQGLQQQLVAARAANAKVAAANAKATEELSHLSRHQTALLHTHQHHRELAAKLKEAQVALASVKEALAAPDDSREGDLLLLPPAAGGGARRKASRSLVKTVTQAQHAVLGARAQLTQCQKVVQAVSR